MNRIYENPNLAFENLGGGEGVCHVAVYANQTAGEAVVVVTEDDRNWQNTSITNRACEIAAIIQQHVLDPYGPWTRVRWVEVYANMLHPEPVFDWVHHTPGFERATWSPATRLEIETLVGDTLEWLPPGDERALTALEDS